MKTIRILKIQLKQRLKEKAWIKHNNENESIINISKIRKGAKSKPHERREKETIKEKQ